MKIIFIFLHFSCTTILWSHDSCFPRSQAGMKAGVCWLHGQNSKITEFGAAPKSLDMYIYSERLWAAHMFCILVFPPHTKMVVVWIEGSMKTCLYGRCRQARKITTALSSVILLLWPCDEKTSAWRLASDASITQPRHILAQPDCHVYLTTRMNSDKMLSL